MTAAIRRPGGAPPTRAPQPTARAGASSKVSAVTIADHATADAIAALEWLVASTDEGDSSSKPETSGGPPSTDVLVPFHALVSRLEAAGTYGAKFAVDGGSDQVSGHIRATAMLISVLIEVALAETSSSSRALHLLQESICGLQDDTADAQSERSRQLSALRSSLRFPQTSRRAPVTQKALSPALMRGLMELLQRIERLLVQFSMTAAKSRSLRNQISIQRLLATLWRAKSFLSRQPH